MGNTYTTIQGDTWDIIARKVYGSEKYAGHLMQANFPLLDIFQFDAGTIMQTPPLPEKERSASGPDWRVAT